MTQLLRKALAEVSRLPEDEQDAIAAVVLAELSSERRWNELFEKSQDVLEELAEEALAEHRTGKTKRLEPDEL
jgi:TRAP-type C4-dicarboxylate transport system substrate-binding protein